MKKLALHFLTTVVVVLFGFFFWASSSSKKVSKSVVMYEDVETKQDEIVTVSTHVPSIVAFNNAPFLQKKGTTEVSIIPAVFSARDTIIKKKEPFYADPSRPGYDIFEVSKTPDYNVVANNIDNVPFKIKITNRGQSPLELAKVTFQAKMGDTYIPVENFSKRLSGLLIAPDQEVIYSISGITLDNVQDGQFFKFILSGMPIKNDKAGNISEVETFSWLFQCKMEARQKQVKREYTYEPELIGKEQCPKCAGKGYIGNPEICSYCKGTGKNAALPVLKCSNCNGTGKLVNKCTYCNGIGVLTHPQSKPRPIKNTMVANGWSVKITTKPSGSNVQVIDTKTGEYKTLPNTTPLTFNWFCTSGQTCPIIVESMGKKVKVLPFKVGGKSDGKESNFIEIDFTKAVPEVKGGKVVD